jgi:hypothetical protein
LKTYLTRNNFYKFFFFQNTFYKKYFEKKKIYTMNFENNFIILFLLVKKLMNQTTVFLKNLLNRDIKIFRFFQNFLKILSSDIIK